MIIVGCDFHPGWQQIAVFDTKTGEVRECKLVNGNGDAERFYRQLPSPTLIGVEACGNSQWLVDMLQRLGHEVWVGDAAQIRGSYVRKQKTDGRDAAHILKLLIEGRFPRLWTPSAEQRNLRQLLIHRHILVGIRVQIKNGLQHLMLNRGVQMKEKLWSQAGQKALRDLTLAGLGRTTEKGPAEFTGESHRADRAAGPGDGESSRRKSAGTVGGECTGGHAFGRRFSQAIPASLSPHGERSQPRWRQRAGSPYDFSGCCAPTQLIRRSFASRVARAKPWSAQARP